MSEETMQFPATFDEFAEQYKIKNTLRINTNGTDLIPVFRVKQWMEENSVNTNSISYAYWEWNPDGMDWNIGSWVCSKCRMRPETSWQGIKDITPQVWSASNYCPNCGAKMMGEKDEKI